MANINDFKIIKLKSKKMFGYLNHNRLSLDDLKMERLGFYHLVLENVTGMSSLSEDESNNEIDDEINESCTILDTKYNKILYNLDVDDLGIDAVYINGNNNSEVTISLFNFKYREKFKPDKTKSENDITRSTKFLEYIIQDNFVDETKNTLVNKKINEIIKHLNSNKICNLKMFIVSNEANGFATASNEYIKILENNYGMSVINISLDDIMAYFNKKKSDYRSSFIISPDDFLSFQCDEKSTQKSYILKLSLLDLIRISCNNENLANNYSLEDDDEILDANLDYTLLYDNVRGFLGETKYNKNILETLKSSPKYFFMYNNGITITAEKIECTPKNSGKKYLFIIGNFQIVNGGQTLRSIYNFLEKNTGSQKLSKLREAYVLLRVFKIDKDDTLQNNIAEYTNSQNSISDMDLKSIDSIQIQLEKYFSELDILYARKLGDVGDLDKPYKSRITMEKMAQILYSSKGYPDRASNQKRRLFQDYYNEIFKCPNFSLENCRLVFEKYQEIEEVYINKVSKVSDQKIFYIIYIMAYTDYDINTAIDLLESLLKSYPAIVAESRKLIQKSFKDYVENQLKIYKH